ncbi:DNA polymerase IV [Sneathiella chungangensis]|uniref:DNA polymerase IV n=1 Tax=Sneathiella chungangensis TaxID=1418234 RepID=A0A845MEA1_9PROT|nr:DNA polymerase IV [Sneathiella chungangensis]MZR21577.1 DNA polymerase IV [Sneathiella chungangensis]
MASLCRNCLTILEEASPAADKRCSHCRSPRVLRHAELFELTIAHVDCDAFYAAVEKRDNPELRAKALIISHDSARSVVSTCCYIARMSGVRSAMPLFKAKRLCPDAVIIPPNMAKYAAVSREIRAVFDRLTPDVEPLSLDEAFLDLSGTEKLHHRNAAQSLAWLAREIEEKVGITVSVGLSYNKYLAKLASDLDKPNGFAVIGRAEAKEFLARRPVSDIWGVGKALGRKLAAEGITTIGQLQHREKAELVARYGVMGGRLYHLSRGEDSRRVEPDQRAKSISAETTFSTDIGEIDVLLARLWPLCEKVSSRLKKSGKAGKTITLKLKTGDFKTITRSHTLGQPTQLAETLYKAVRPLLEKAAPNHDFRLIGVGISSFGDIEDADRPDLLSGASGHDKEVEAAIEKLRNKFGDTVIAKGRGLAGKH